MGLLSASPSSPSPAAPAPSTDGAYIAPDRNARAHCWAARDNFFACLEKNNIVDSIKEKEKADSACGPAEKEFGKECAKSWVTYFKQRRVMEHNKAQTLARLKKEGAKPMPEGMGPPGVSGKSS